MRNVAVNVVEAVVPGAGHWLMEENPTFTYTLAGEWARGAVSAGLQRCGFRGLIILPAPGPAVSSLS